jgi:hypothetical protein
MRDFDEHQEFRQWWLVLLLAVVVVASWAPLVAELIFGDDTLEDPLWVLVLVGVVGLVLPGWVLWVRLETTVDAEAVHIRYRGLFVRRRIVFSDIERFEAVTYRPIAEYGGWGIRRRGKGKMAYSTSGNQGVRLYLADGKEVLIGSQMAEELVAAMRSWVKR